MHLAKLDGIEFKELPPAKDWGERLDRAKKGLFSAATKGEKTISDGIGKIDKKVGESGWKDKLGGLLRRKSKMEEEKKQE
jgi:hypothetical protein